MNIWHDISPKVITKEKFTAVIEIPKGSKVKYELDKTTGLLRMDRILYTSTHYPANYGFIPRTYAEDGDPLDVLVLCSETLAPLSLVDCYPIGVISMLDNGAADEKIICIPLNDPTYIRTFQSCLSTFLMRCVISSRYTRHLNTRTLWSMMLRIVNTLLRSWHSVSTDTLRIFASK